YWHNYVLDPTSPHALRVRRGRVQDVVVPVALQHRLVALEILVIGRGGVGRGEDREELRHEIDEHDAAGPNLGTGPAGDKRAPVPKACGPGRDGLTTLSGVVAHLAAHLGEEPPLGGGETVDAARRD